MMTLFWRAEPLTEAEERLLQFTFDAHSKSAFRENISTTVLMQAAVGSGDFTKALAAALNTLGGMHAPLKESYQILSGETPVNFLNGKRIPGWGNSFVKGEPDPIWNEVAEQLSGVNPSILAKIREITDLLHSAGKKVFPNPSIYTAAVGMTLGIPVDLLPWIFIQSRLCAWAILFQKVTTEEKS